MNQLLRFWHAIEDVNGQCASLFEWRSRLASDFDFVHARRYLQPLNRFADSIPVANAPGEDWHRIVPQGGDRVAAVAADGSGELIISKSETLLYRIDFRVLCRELGQLFGFDELSDPITDLPGIHFVGDYRPFAGYAFPALLACPRDDEAAKHAAEMLTARIDGPLLLLFPTEQAIKRRIAEILARRKSVCICLTEAVESECTGKLRASAAFSRVLATFQADNVPQAKAQIQAAFFPTPPHAKWNELHVKFIDGHTVNARIGDVSRVLTYADIGFANRRNRQPTKQWDLLHDFSLNYGHLRWDSPGAGRKVQARKDALANGLREFFRIDGEPIEYIDKPDKGWRTVFSIDRE